MIRPANERPLLQRHPTTAGHCRCSVVSPKSVSFRCAQIGLWQGARRAHPPKWGCNRRATQPQPNFSATRRAAALFPADFVAHSLQIHFGIGSSFAPRLREKPLAAKAHGFRGHHTSRYEVEISTIIAATILISHRWE